ncbi:dynein regulatory complex protein 9-like [Lycorma delicatula]|uniref:dynein regulatory complex protein 9-like n=1 Tax=Lycorma delicatula TaxID=130591 RepID=UPI003F512AC0
MAIKTEKERLFIEETLVSVCNELFQRRTWSHLQTIVEKLKNSSKEHCKILQESINKSQNQLKKLKLKILLIEKNSEEKIKKYDIEISSLKDELEDVNFRQEVELKYIDKWENSRMNQSLTLAEMEERRLKGKLEMLVNQSDNDERVHAEIAHYLDSATVKLEEEAETWRENYKKTMAFYKKELIITKEKRELQLQKLKALTDKFYDHRQKIKEYIEEKKERERVQAMEEHLNKMATKIQAWWRGVMVRRHLGPYKKKGKVKEKPKFKGKANNKTEPIQEKSTVKPKGK